MGGPRTNEPGAAPPGGAPAAAGGAGGAQVLAGVTRAMGKEVWQRTILALTRSQLTSPPRGTTYGPPPPPPHHTHTHTHTYVIAPQRLPDAFV